MKNLLLLLISFNPIILLSQMNVDSLKSIWEDRSNSYQVRMESMNFYLNNEEQKDDPLFISVSDSLEYLAKLTKASFFIASSNKHKGNTFTFKGEYDNAIHAFNQVIHIGTVDNDTLTICQGNLNLGACFLFMGDLEKSMYYLLESLEYVENKLNDSNFLELYSSLLNNIAVICLQTNEYDKTIHYLRKSIKIDLSQDNWDGAVGGYVNISHCHFSNNKIDSANLAIDSALNIISKEKINSAFCADAYTSKGKLLILEYDTLGARAMFDKSLKTSREVSNGYYISLSLIEISKISPTSEAIEKQLEALTIAKKNKIESLQIASYELLYQNYKLIGETDSALKMIENHKLLKHGVNTSKPILKLADFENEKEIEKIKKDKEKSVVKIYKNNVVLIVVAIVLLLSGVWMFLLFRKRIKVHDQKKKFLMTEISRLRKLQDIKNSTDGKKSKDLDQTHKTFIESVIQAKFNTSDWKISNCLYHSPGLTNPEIANKVNLSVDGVKSSLKKMYRLFDIETGKNMKLNLVLRISQIMKSHQDKNQ